MYSIEFEFGLFHQQAMTQLALTLKLLEVNRRHVTRFQQYFMIVHL
jgi:hypothetical protein